MLLRSLLPQMDGKKISQLKSDSEIDPDWISDVRATADATEFSQLIYMMTMFLDAKEINDLLTTLINKLENIASLLTVLKQVGGQAFTYDYKFFNSSGYVARELRAIKGFARMEQPLPSAKREMFAEAAQILGLDARENEMKEIYDAIFGEFFAEHYEDSEEELKALFKKKYPNERYDRNKLFAHDKGLRNFIGNNVIKSSRFRYLIRFNNAKKTREIAENEAVLRFVLKRMPETQIDRYFASCGGDRAVAEQNQKHSFLIERIRSIKFNDFKNVVQNDRDRNTTGADKADKAQKQAIIGLYLTVMYLVTKNLVNINARYTIAIHCLEIGRASCRERV